jgi:hypothetical protein
MAASGATPIILYHSTTGSAVPSNANLSPGELAVNIADMKLYCENGSGVVTLLSSADAAAGNFTTVDINGGTIDGAVIGGSSAAAGSFTTLGASSTATFAAGAVGTPAITTTGDTNTGIFFPAADTIAFAEGGAEAMRIDSGGRALIGATSTFFNSDGKLYLAGDSNSNNGGLYVSRFQNTSGGSPTINILKSRGSSIGSMTTVQNADELGGLVWRASDGTSFIASAVLDVEVDGTVASNQIPSRMRFLTANSAGSVTERARITSGGFFKASVDGTYINAAGYHELRSNAGAITVSVSNTNASTPNGIFIYWSGASPNNTSQYFLYCQDATNEKAIIWANGNFESRTNSYGGISDVKLKQDIVDANSQWDDIKGLRVVKYRFKDEVAADPNYPSHLGVIAQEVELVSPGLIDEHPDYEEVEVTDEEGNVTTERQATGTVTKSVKYSILYMKAVKALQEAIERIETLEAKVAALEAK